MTILYAFCIALILIVIVQAVGNVIIQRNLTRSIDMLSDKIMARNYREYVGMKRSEEEPVIEGEENEPLSWHDNPN